MIYVGSRLRGVSKHASIEPALINPDLAGTHPTPDRAGDLVDYWPSYSHLTPASRSAYLDWLAAGRPGGAYIGYVFLFFYGIERRVLFDAAYVQEARAETPALIDEVERLIRLYQGNGSFRGYAGDFLSLAPLIRGAVDVGELTPPLTRRGWDFPVELKLALGAIVDASEPLPAPWALSWLRMHPDIRLRTAATRCAEEFNELFRIRYQEEYGDGMTIRRNKTPLRLSYHPASASLHDAIKVDPGDLPDVSRLKAPVRQLQQVAGEVIDELDAYSRWVGRHDNRDSLAAIALLPRELAKTRQPAELRRLLDRIEDAMRDGDTATLRVADLIAEYPSRKPDILTAREGATFTDLLEQRGFGIAPDIRYSGINPSKYEHAAVFRLPDEATEPAEDYFGATVLLQLGAAVSVADGTVTQDEERHLEAHLEQALNLSRVDRSRLRAHLQWLLANPPRLTGMKSRLQALAPAHRDLAGRFVLSVAAADGHVSRKEVRVLGRIYTLLGLDSDQLHRDLHTLASGPATHPVTVAESDKSIGYPIPPQPDAGDARADDGLVLDKQRIAEVVASTREVTQLLTEIFEGSIEEVAQESHPVAIATETDDEQPTSESELDGLDSLHAELVRYLAQRPIWSREEFEQTAGELGLMPAGAVETINDEAFERCGEPLLEGDDPVEVNDEALKELLDGR